MAPTCICIYVGVAQLARGKSELWYKFGKLALTHAAIMLHLQTSVDRWVQMHVHKNLTCHHAYGLSISVFVFAVITIRQNA